MKKKKGFTIKRESIKGKYYIVHRRGNKLIEKIPYGTTKGKSTKKQAIRKFKSKNTILPGDVNVERLTNFDRISDFTGRKRPRNKIVQWHIQGTLKDGKIIHASSATIGDFRARNLRHAKEEAEDSFWRRVHQHFTKGYDPLKGKALAHKLKNVKSGWVYYRAK